MVKVSVCIPEMPDAPASFLSLLQNKVAIPGRIDDSGLSRARIRKQVGIGTHGTQYKIDNLKHYGPS
jgi:hypothetical protein